MGYPLPMESLQKNALFNMALQLKRVANMLVNNQSSFGVYPQSSVLLSASLFALASLSVVFYCLGLWGKSPGSAARFQP